MSSVETAYEAAAVGRARGVCRPRFGSLMQAAVGVVRHAGLRYKKTGAVHGIELIRLATKIAKDIDFFTLAENILDFFASEGLQHAGYPIARAWAVPAHALRLERHERFFPEQSPDQGVGIQCQQLFMLECGGQVAYARPGFCLLLGRGALVAALCRQALQQ